MLVLRFESMRGAEQGTIVHDPANPNSETTTVLPPDDPRQKIAFEIGETLVLHFAEDHSSLIIGAPLTPELQPEMLYRVVD